jgi:hypothetical protein
VGIFAGWIGLLLGLLIPLMGYMVLFYQEVVVERFHTFRFWLKKMKNPKLVSDLISLRKEIFADLNKVEPGIISE